MTISRRVDKPHHPNLYMNNSVITEVQNHKHLGLTISNDGSYHNHIDVITEKAYRRLNILRKFKFILDRKTLETVYLTFIRPLLEYADVVWDNGALFLSDKIEKVQIEAARIVTGGTLLTSIHNLYLETGWEKLKGRREAHRLTYFYKMKNCLTPSYLSDLVPDSFGNIHGYNTRNPSIIPPIMARTTLYTNYFLPATVRSWNMLPVRVKSSTSLASFKSSFKDRCVKKPDYYYVGKRIGQILHSRLRMHCSSLNQDLFLKNIVDSPSCQCGAIESAHHFLLHCPRYNVQRQLYLDPIFVNPLITYDCLIFGSLELTFEQNTEVFLAVQSFICASKRFERN